MADELYYIQDTRQYVGNSVMFWRVDGNGYTTNPDEAWKVPLEKALGHRETDVPIPAALVERIKKYHVDMQDLRSK
jgi:hypothetical protein